MVPAVGGRWRGEGALRLEAAGAAHGSTMCRRDKGSLDYPGVGGM